MRYHWRSFLVAGIISIFFGIGSLLFTWFILSVFFHFDYNRAIKEIREEQRHVEMLEALDNRTNTTSEYLTTQEAREIEEALRDFKNANNDWGEA